MWRRCIGSGGALGPKWRRLAAFVILVLAAGSPGPALAADSVAAEANAAGWAERIITQLEAEALADLDAAPALWTAIEREWRSFDREGSSLGALVNLGWVALVACVAIAAEHLVARGLSQRRRRIMRAREDGPSLIGLLLLLLCDLAGLAVFVGVVSYGRRHFLPSVGVTANLGMFAAYVLIHWRIAVLIIRMLLRPHEPIARLIELSDDEARRLTRFLSGIVLTVDILISFGRISLADEDSGAAHVVGLVIAILVCALYVATVFRARGAAQALIRGRQGGGIIAAMRAALARAWIAIGLTAVGLLMLFFVFGLSLNLLSYYHAFVSTLGIVFLLLVLDRVAERGWPEAGSDAAAPPGGINRLVGRALYRVLRGVVLLAALLILSATWIDAVEMSSAASVRVTHSITGAATILFIAYVAWELGRLAIDRHLRPPSTPTMPGEADEVEVATASRLQTALPFLRAALAIAIGVLAVLVTLSRLGVDTAPLIAGAGVLGLAISFGSQSLVRDIISGLFFMWDDAFRVGEYIDTGRLRGTVEGMSIRSVKLRHHNGPLHTIPYGQLGSVSNLSRDWAILKFNLRLERGSDIEVVRKTIKQIGIQMQDDPEIASEVLQPLKLQGIVEFADTALVVRLKFTARPVKPSWIQRQYLKRIYAVFPEKGIAFASGALTLQTYTPVEGATAPVPGTSPGTSPVAANPILPLAAPTRVA